jgi:Leucine-rich repeat (LRR) protein
LVLKELPDLLSNLTSLQSLRLRGSQISSGPLPSSLASLTKLESLQLEGGPNNLGTLPPEWGQLHSLTDLYLHNMHLTGQFPSSYADIPVLNEVNMMNVQGLTSTLQDWQQFLYRRVAPYPMWLTLDGIGLQGSVTADLFNPGR